MIPTEIIKSDRVAIGEAVFDREFGNGNISFVSEDKRMLLVRFEEECGVVKDIPKLYQYKSGYTKYDVDETAKEYCLKTGHSDCGLPNSVGKQGNLF